MNGSLSSMSLNPQVKLPELKHKDNGDLETSDTVSETIKVTPLKVPPFPTVFDACLQPIQLPDVKKMNQKQIKAYRASLALYE